LTEKLLRRILGPKREQVKSRWRNMHNEGLHHLLSSPDTITADTSRRGRLAGKEAQRDTKMHTQLQ
jgi:hypothetical protein